MAGEGGVGEPNASASSEPSDSVSQNGSVAGTNPDDDVPQDQNESEQLAVTSPDELHLTEEWFHGKITRDEAVTLLRKHTDLGNGVFLVRESTTFIGDYSLSF